MEYDTDFPIVIIIDDFNENQKNDLRVQAVFRLSRHSNISIFIISQRFYELPNRTIQPTVIFIIYSNQFISEMFEIYIKRKHLWI